MKNISQSGNVVLALFGAVGILGAVGYGYSTLIKGPARGVSEITSRTASETDIFAAANILISSARETQAAEGDCDTDSYLEPLPWRAPAGAPAPAGGGLIPTGTPAVTTDSWGTVFGYCAWDHGAVSVSDNNAGCGGSAALRREGGEVKVEEVIAVISAGPDKIFQTTCSNYVNPATPLITKAAGSDDLLVKFTYAEAFDAAGMGGGGLGDVEDDACVPEAIGLMRYEMEVVQVCLDDGAGGAVWKEVGSEADATPGYTPTNNATVSTLYTSNAISFTGYFGTRLATVDNGGTIILNGVPVGASAQVAVGDTVAIRATSSATLGTVRAFTLNISSILRVWTLQTRDPIPATFSITPSGPTDMNVSGPGNPALGTQRTFTITNTGEIDTGAVSAAVLSNSTNFTVTGDNCDPNASIAPGGTCTVFVRPQATADGPFSGTLTVSAVSTVNGVANLSGTGSGFSCTNVGGFCWYLSAANESCDTACASRGGYHDATRFYAGSDGTNANCKNVFDALGLGGTTVTDNNSCNSGSEYMGCMYIIGPARYRCTNATTNGSGARSASGRACACNNGSSCVLDGQTVPHGSSHTFYSATSHANCASISQSRTCTNGTLDGSGTYQYASCSAVDPCTTGPVGTVCADGAVYAGIVDGRRFYVANGDEVGLLRWKIDQSNTSGTDSNTDGFANTDAMIAAGAALHPAGQRCRSKGADWYLPARDQLIMLYTNRTSLGAANLPTGGNDYWSSTQSSSDNARTVRISTGGVYSSEKDESGDLIRCVRR